MSNLLIGDPVNSPLTLGLIDTVEGETAPLGSAEIAKNIVYDNGMIGSRGGIKLLGSIGTTTKITGLHTASRKDGTKILLRTYDVKLEKYNTTTDAWALINNGLTADKDVEFADYSDTTRDSAFFVNYTDVAKELNLTADTITNHSDVSDIFPRGKFIMIKNGRCWCGGGLDYTGAVNNKTILGMSKVGTPEDFRYTSPTRAAGEGSIFNCGEGGDPVLRVIPVIAQSVGGSNVTTTIPAVWVFKRSGIYLIRISDDDSSAIRDLQFTGTGIRSTRAVDESGSSIVYIDEPEGKKPRIVRLGWNPDANSYSTDDELSKNIHKTLDGMVSDISFTKHFKDFILFGLRTSDSDFPNKILFYDRRYKAFSVFDLPFATVDIFNGELVAGSSVENTIYQMFYGNDDDGNAFTSEWRSNPITFGNPFVRKNQRVVELDGYLNSSANLEVYAIFDNGTEVLLDTLEGTGDYVDSSATIVYGVSRYGDKSYAGSGTGGTTLRRFKKQIKLPRTKFYNLKIGFRSSVEGSVWAMKFINFSDKKNLKSNYR